MMGYLGYFNAVKSKDVINSPYNQRQDLMADRVIRGKILDKDGEVLAETVTDEDGNEIRNYPYGEMIAHVVGYSVHGKSGLESQNNFDLLTSNSFFLEKISNEFKGEKNEGDNVVTTLDADLQEAAYDALGDNKGAVVVMEASTGKILSMVSKPAFDPNTVEEDWAEINQDTNGILVNRATQGAYAPGSTFKIVTTLEYMRENPNYDSYQYDCEGKITHNDLTIHCFNKIVHGHETLRAAIADSCNAAFANIGLGLDKKQYRKTAEELLFNSKLPRVLPYRESDFEVTENTSDGEIMMTAMGQGKTQVSPYHMALITAAVANNGTLMKPYLVSEIKNNTGTQIKKYMPEEYKELMTAKEAAQLKDYMTSVVEEGTATQLKSSSYTAAGKTGTAEYSSDKSKSHSWFIGFSNVDNPELVISVVIEGADDTGARAVPIAKKVFDTYYSNK